LSIFGRLFRKKALLSRQSAPLIVAAVGICIVGSLGQTQQSGFDVSFGLFDETNDACLIRHLSSKDQTTGDQNSLEYGPL
jgi:hypothetical protein